MMVRKNVIACYQAGVIHMSADTLIKVNCKSRSGNLTKKREKMREKYIIQAKKRETGEDIMDKLLFFNKNIK